MVGAISRCRISATASASPSFATMLMATTRPSLRSSKVNRCSGMSYPQTDLVAPPQSIRLAGSIVGPSPNCARHRTCPRTASGEDRYEVAHSVSPLRCAHCPVAGVERTLTGGGESDENDPLLTSQTGASFIVGGFAPRWIDQCALALAERASRTAQRRFQTGPTVVTRERAGAGWTAVICTDIHIDYDAYQPLPDPCRPHASPDCRGASGARAVSERRRGQSADPSVGCFAAPAHIERGGVRTGPAR